MRAALYARVSTEEQTEGYSIDAQRRAFQALLQGRGWTAYREYIDEGKSARTDNINRRPAFKEMVDDALAKTFDVLVVHKLDRFSRNLRITLEYFDKLSKAGVTFLSINEQMDFSTPWGNLALTLLGGLAQFYSDNLSLETKKGWAERKAQGLYCGLLPFGAMKGEDGVPVPHPDTYPGLVMAFGLAAQGKSDREVAVTLNSAGHRTTGNQGNRPFSKDTVKGMLANRFYLGYLPDGNGGWIRGKHEPFVDEELFNAALRERERRANKPRTIRSDAKPCSLSGVARCAECGGTLRVFRARGRVRLMCTTRIKDGSCRQLSGYLETYENQLIGYLKAFHIPEDYQEKILEAHRKLQPVYDDASKQKARLEARLKKIKELYEWGHKTKEEYLTDYAEIQKDLKALAPQEDKKEVLEKLALFLKDITLAWEQANQEHRNRLASQLFEAIWVNDKKVWAVAPRPEFKPFFDLQYEGVSHGVLQIRPRWDSNPRSPP